MELHLILDGGAGTLNDQMWLENSSSSSPLYQELSPSNETSVVDTISVQQTIIPSNVYHSPSGVDGGATVCQINWEDKRSNDSLTYTSNRGLIRSTNSSNGVSSIQRQNVENVDTTTITTTTAAATTATATTIPTTKTTTTTTTISDNSSNNHHRERLIRNDNNTTVTLKRRSGENLQTISDDHHNHHHGRKIIKKYGLVNNDSRQGWSTQVEDFAENLVADFDGSLSALAATDLATALASYNVSEALLALPSLTVFKQEAPSPDNHQSNPSLNHVSQRGIEIPSTGNGSTVIDVMEADSNNNNNNSQNPGNSGQTTAASLHQLLYSTDNDYSTISSSSVQGGNQVSSSQQENEGNEDCRFQYVLAAATSIATKINEETLTYLNQGQSYEIKLKKLGDLSAYRGKMLKSSIRICFHERRLQYTEREQMLSWQKTRPGERLLEVDVPLSYGTVDVRQQTNSSNIVEFMWDPTKEVGVYIKVNCISTEFTPKKHGGEKGVPFRIQVETRIAGGGCRLHAASCQVKVFKLKGADRKHKQDRDKVLRRPRHEQDKYQPSYDCTVLSDIPLDCLTTTTTTTPSNTEHHNRNESDSIIPFAPSDAATPQTRTAMGGSSTSPIAGPIPISINSSGLLPIVSTNPETVKESLTPTIPSIQSPTVSVSTLKNIADTNAMQPPTTSLSPDSNATETSNWLLAGRFQKFQSTFTNFSASDILRLSRDDLIQICGLPDGIRLFNALHSKPPTPRLTLYFSADGSNQLWRAVYLDNLTSNALTSKLYETLGTICHQKDHLHSVVILGPQGIHVLVTDELVTNIKDESMFIIETIKDPNTERYKILMKPSSR